ncbi:SecDF P1 head subdomain-containing protein [Gordonia araii]|uniref:SecDF P1 head subdomain-containing protein n=1 Tax=Gordonia araii TaxID=263909 RepID=UPI00068049B7|nr:hypothetical protein [Gordonia araii]NNG99254.1 hypothetical protein [Gordonia araii NBRC 100433]
MNRSIRVLVLALLVAVGLVAACSRDSGEGAGEGARVEFTVESLQSSDGEFAPGTDRDKLVADAAKLLAQRLSDNGLKDPKVSIENGASAVVVTTASGTRADVVALASAGVLAIRPVVFTTQAMPDAAGLDVELRQANASTPPAEMARRAQQLKCGGGVDELAGRDDAADLLVACSQNGKSVYSLGPAVISGAEIEKATATPGSNDNWNVTMTFRGEAKTKWPAYTAKNIGQATAFVLDSRVLSAPVIQTAIAGPTEISGDFGEAEAKHLASMLSSGSLPVRFTPKD